jgi:hypothetical protein
LQQSSSRVPWRQLVTPSISLRLTVKCLIVWSSTYNCRTK